MRECLQKRLPTSFSKVKFTEEAWNVKFYEHEDRDLFVQALNQEVTFHGCRLRAKNWVFLYTPKELWEEVEQLADAANENYHEGIGGGKNAQGTSQKCTNGQKKTVNNMEMSSRRVASAFCPAL